MTLIIYEKIPEAKLRELADEVIPQLEKWFENNPKRRVCSAELWYGRHHKIQRKAVPAQINAIVEAILKERS